MDDINSLLEGKADRLNLDEKLSELEIISREIQRSVPKAQFNVPKLYPGRKALVIAKNGHDASEIKFSQISIVRSLNHILEKPLKDLVVIVR